MSKLTPASLAPLALLLAAVVAASCQTPAKKRRRPSLPEDKIYKAHNPENRKLAAELIALKRIDAKIKQDLDERFADVVGHLGPEQRTKFFDALRQKVNIRTIREEIIDIYTESLDRKQLTTLVAFYKSELGQFIADTEPKLNASIFETLSSSSTHEAERILLEMIKEKDKPQYEEARSPIRKALDNLLFAH